MQFVRIKILILLAFPGANVSFVCLPRPRQRLLRCSRPTNAIIHSGTSLPIPGKIRIWTIWTRVFDSRHSKGSRCVDISPEFAGFRLRCAIVYKQSYRAKTLEVWTKSVNHAEMSGSCDACSACRPMTVNRPAAQPLYHQRLLHHQNVTRCRSIAIYEFCRGPC